MGWRTSRFAPWRRKRSREGSGWASLDFSVNGFRIDAIEEFIDYAEPSDRLTTAEQFERLQQHLFLFAFYPKLRFSREIETHRPALPKRISVLGQIVRS